MFHYLTLDIKWSHQVEFGIQTFRVSRNKINVSGQQNNKYRYFTTICGSCRKHYRHIPADCFSMKSRIHHTTRDPSNFNDVLCTTNPKPSISDYHWVSYQTIRKAVPHDSKKHTNYSKFMILSVLRVVPNMSFRITSKSCHWRHKNRFPR